MAPTPQKTGKVPDEVAKLYAGSSKKPRESRTKHFNHDNSRNKFAKINDFFSKSSDTRVSRFDENREKIPDEILEPNIKSLTEINTLITSASAVSNEYEQLTKCEELDVKKLFTVMSNMNKTMIDLTIQLKNAIVSRNEVTINKFTKELKTCTTFISNEINHVRREIKDIKSNDETECLKIAHLCARDSRRIWIRFAYTSDAENLRDKNSFASIKEMLSQLNVHINMSQYPIESFFYQSRTFSPDQVAPEIALCCIFVNSTLATIVKNGIRKFNKNLEETGQSNLMRYKVNTDWSFEIRSLLRPCNEMKRCNVLNKVFITTDGIKVYHKELQRENGSSYSSSFVNSFRKLDLLRKKLKDFNFTVPTSQAYNSEYFSKTLEDRLKIRDNYVFQSNSNNDEYEATDDEDMNVSIVPLASQSK
ncbi:hypothetical protein ACKWTF_005073 [Chironomus riparius]